MLTTSNVLWLQQATAKTNMQHQERIISIITKHITYINIFNVFQAGLDFHQHWHCLYWQSVLSLFLVIYGLIRTVNINHWRKSKKPKTTAVYHISVLDFARICMMCLQVSRKAGVKERRLVFKRLWSESSRADSLFSNWFRVARLQLDVFVCLKQGALYNLKT